MSFTYKQKRNRGLKYLNDLKAFNTQMIWIVFMKIFNNTIHREKY